MRRRNIQQNSEPKECLFCTEQRGVDYKDAETLRRFMSPYARILPDSRTGRCAKHQRQLAQAIKRARFLVLLPYTTK